MTYHLQQPKSLQHLQLCIKKQLVVGLTCDCCLANGVNDVIHTINDVCDRVSGGVIFIIIVVVS